MCISRVSEGDVRDDGLVRVHFSLTSSPLNQRMKAGLLLAGSTTHVKFKADPASMNTSASPKMRAAAAKKREQFSFIAVISDDDLARERKGVRKWQLLSEKGAPFSRKAAHGGR